MSHKQIYGAVAIICPQHCKELEVQRRQNPWQKVKGATEAEPGQFLIFTSKHYSFNMETAPRLLFVLSITTHITDFPHRYHVLKPFLLPNKRMYCYNLLSTSADQMCLASNCIYDKHGLKISYEAV